MTTTQTIEEQQHLIPDSAPALSSGPDWLNAKRECERAAYNNEPMPPRGLHLWRYTDPQRFQVDFGALDVATGDVRDSAEKLEKRHLDEGRLAALAIDYGGRKIEIHRGPDEALQGLVICPLSEAVKTHRDLVEQHLYSSVNAATGKFAALNGALWTDGLFVFVPENTTVELPVHILHEAGQEGSLVFPRTLLVIGRNAEATVVDEYCGGPNDHDEGLAHSNGAVEIVGSADSRSRYLYLQRQGRGTVSYLAHRTALERGANAITIPFSFGAAISKQNFGVSLDGPGANSHMYGLLFGTGRQHFDNHTMHRHTAGKTYSDIDFKVALRDRSVSAYTGLIGIDHDAQNCEAYQENRNLLLNKGTRAETIPELEILNEDVSCSHGATVGPIDDMQIFYLTARGIPRDEAVRMIVSGFVSSTVRMAPADVQERLTQVIEERLEDL
jgi:Fe-S cluster assembly protein SufD